MAASGLLFTPRRSPQLATNHRTTPLRESLRKITGNGTILERTKCFVDAHAFTRFFVFDVSLADILYLCKHATQKKEGCENEVYEKGKAYHDKLRKDTYTDLHKRCLKGVQRA